MKMMRKIRLMAMVVALGVVASLFGGVAMAQEKIVVDGSTTVGPIALGFAEYFMKQNKGVEITVNMSGSSMGAKGLIDGTCHVGAMSRPMKDKELAQAVEKGVAPVPHVVALDGIAVIVHKSNPIKGLTMAQLKDIYSGKTKNWKDLGGPNTEIVVVTRDTSSGTYETFENLVMGGEKMADSNEVVNSNKMGHGRVSTTQNAIAYVGLGYVDDAIKTIEIEGVEATKDTIKSGDYPIARPLFMYTNAYPKMGSNVYKFVTLYLTKDGKEIVEAKGFIPVFD